MHTGVEFILHVLFSCCNTQLTPCLWMLRILEAFTVFAHETKSKGNKFKNKGKSSLNLCIKPFIAFSTVHQMSTWEWKRSNENWWEYFSVQPEKGHFFFFIKTHLSCTCKKLSVVTEQSVKAAFEAHEMHTASCWISGREGFS